MIDRSLRIRNSSTYYGLNNGRLTNPGGIMPFIYPNADKLGGTPKVGNGDCVALVEFYANVPPHSSWKQGEHVLDNPNIRPGTAIATFVHGRYPNKSTGNHAAFFLRHAAKGQGFFVMDQWIDKPGAKPRLVDSRAMPSRHVKQNNDGTWYRASDNADAFYVIERR
jgi:hypothetical protein